MRIFSIDPGLRNLAWAIIKASSNNNKIISVVHYELIDTSAWGKDVSEIACRFAKTRGSFIDTCDVVCIERQMMGQPKLLEVALSTRLFNRRRLVLPHVVKRFFKFPQPLTYYQRKQKAIELALKFMTLKQRSDLRDNYKKKDDICDAILNGIAYLASHSRPPIALKDII